MKLLKENLNRIVMCLIELSVGTLLLINPLAFTSLIIIATGIGLIISGILHVLKYFRMSPQDAAMSRQLVRGLISLLLGLMLCLRFEIFISALSLLTFFYGSAILVSAMEKLQWSVDMLRLKKEHWFIPGASSVIAIICGFIIVFNPFTSTRYLWIFAGVTLIAEAACDVASLFCGINKIYKQEQHEEPEIKEIP